MLPFVYENPVKVIFGAGKISAVAQEIRGYKTALLVCAKGPFRENGLYEKVKGLLESGGCKVVEMDDIDSNPRLSSVNQGVACCRAHSVQVVVALGGGSAMDASKVIAASAKTGISPYEYIWGSRPKVEDSLDTIMIPSIAATGTELNPSAVIVNDETQQKYYTDCVHAKVAILDPEIYAQAPYRLAVWGAMDIVSHTLEYYLNGCTASAFQLRFSEGILLTVFETLRALKAQPQDLNARGELMWAAVMAWGGLTKIGRGDPEMSCHWIEESFSGYFGTHHGACLGVLTPRWMRMVYQSAPAPFARLARNVFGVREADDTAAAAQGIQAYIGFLVEIGAPLTLADISDQPFGTAQLEHVADTALGIYQNGIGKLKRLSREEIVSLLESCKQPIA